MFVLTSLSLVGFVLLCGSFVCVCVCACFCLFTPKLSERLTNAGGMHAAHTSVQNGGIFPSNEQFSATNENMLLQYELCHHDYCRPRGAAL